MHDVRTTPVVIAGGAIALTVMCVIAVVLGLMHWRNLAPGGAPIQTASGTELAAPGLYAAPQDDTAKERAKKEKWLHSSGPGHIAIEDAMAQLAAQEGKR